MNLIRKGKVKEVYDTGGDDLLFRFTNNISVFDKIIPTAIPKKGEVLNRAAEYWFGEVEKLGIKTHFLSRPGPEEMRVRKFHVEEDYAKITPESTNVMIPLEVVCRHYLAGSMLDRVKRGDVTMATLGFPADHAPEYGLKLPQPLVEFTTKLEKVDRPLSDKEAQDMAKLSDAEFQGLKDAVLRIDAMMQDRVGPRGLVHVDGKKEFALGDDRELVIIDTFGTPDEDRWWDAEALAQGKFVELSKEFVRQHYRVMGYHEKLEDARRKGEAEPPIPALPDEVARQVTELYVSLFERITGQAF